MTGQRPPGRLPSAPAPATSSASISSASPARSSAGIGDAAKATVTAHGMVIGPVVYGLAVPGTPPQPEIDAIPRPESGITVQVVVWPGTTGLAQMIVPPWVARPVTM